MGSWMAPLIVLASGSSWTLVVGGDIMLNGVAPSRQPFRDVAQIFRKADVAYANLEIPLTTAITRTPHKSAAAIAARDQFVLKADPGHAAGLSQAGFDLLSLANNHAMDYGVAGLKQMRGLLSRQGIKHNGAGGNLADAEKPAVYTASNGMRVALVSFLAFRGWPGLKACWPATETGPGIAVLRFNGEVNAAARTRISQVVAGARALADLVLVAPHWGLEKQTVPTSYQVALGRAWIDAGADVVVGAHPHVLQGAELYQDRPIFYSMGNLVSPRGGTTGLVRLTFEKRAFRKAEFIPARIQSGRVTPSARSKDSNTRFSALGARIQSAYPHARSRNLPLAP
ncbi:MAG TPA: CapA family protein [Fimbriimonadaceae bacterium]|nr:CapA family protein [Fimbriimonadaceae bacterium]HRJ32555.1 CapA family protein [Fimbriimonadaceae bacterium]